jgi:hypothetical protein
MGNVMNSVVVEARAYAFGMGSDPGAIAKISATSASAPGIAVFYSGKGNLAKAKACVANLYMSGRSGYTYDQTPAGFLAGLHGDGRLTALASAKMGADCDAQPLCDLQEVTRPGQRLRSRLRGIHDLLYARAGRYRHAIYRRYLLHKWCFMQLKYRRMLVLSMLSAALAGCGMAALVAIALHVSKGWSAHAMVGSPSKARWKMYYVACFALVLAALAFYIAPFWLVDQCYSAGRCVTAFYGDTPVFASGAGLGSLVTLTVLAAIGQS